jgi:hypothetical protein
MKNKLKSNKKIYSQPMPITFRHNDPYKTGTCQVCGTTPLNGEGLLDLSGVLTGDLKDDLDLDFDEREKYGW